MLSRREMILGSAVLGAAAPARAAPSQGPAREVVIASANGLRACARAMALMQQGRDTLDAVVAGVAINEDDPEDNSVGYGGLPNEAGVVELDASVMHGPTRRCGAVASVRGIKNVARLAKVVMEQTDHVMLVGQGAADFARAWGFAEENLLTEKSRLAWLVWKQSLRDSDGRNNWTDGLDGPPGQVRGALRERFPDAPAEWLAWAQAVALWPPTGTINCLALNKKGELSGTTTTSGLAWKIPGRVGDSPVVGAGLYVDQDVGAAGSTGRGEENIRIAGAHTIVENMRRGLSPREACLDALRRISRNYGDDAARLDKFSISFYALRRDGEYGSAALWSRARRDGVMRPAEFAVNTGQQSRHEPCAYLLDRK